MGARHLSQKWSKEKRLETCLEEDLRRLETCLEEDLPSLESLPRCSSYDAELKAMEDCLKKLGEAKQK